MGAMMNSTVDISGLLSNIRQLRESAFQDNQLPLSTFKGEEVGNKLDFSKLLQSALSKVNDIQQHSESLKTAYELGTPGVDITQVMIASQKASLAFEAMQQVRNKLIDAYREIMNMPI